MEGNSKEQQASNYGIVDNWSDAYSLPSLKKQASFNFMNDTQEFYPKYVSNKSPFTKDSDTHDLQSFLTIGTTTEPKNTVDEQIVGFSLIE